MLVGPLGTELYVRCAGWLLMVSGCLLPCPVQPRTVLKVEIAPDGQTVKKIFSSDKVQEIKNKRYWKKWA